ncbi:MAG: SCO family protein [Rhodospirillales bacterium]|nr:SCO family protein [Rhodospirillales bacterium]
MKSHLLACGALLLALSSGSVLASPPALPARSIYRIPPLQLVDQRGRSFDFASLAGQPRLIGMFYGSCKMACPIEIETFKHIEAKVVQAGGRPIPVLLVSFDPAHDTVPMLRMAAAEHHLRAPEFELTRPQRGDYRGLGGVLGIAWRPLPGGGFEHNVVITLLDAQGRIVAQAAGEGGVPAAFVQAIFAQEGGRDH